ncbi:MAG TPA: hypothetical protein VN939_20035, partial [Chthoniobacterales bacterium]|nr:hypothetical protein [Chthoniobacterales bacterium]
EEKPEEKVKSRGGAARVANSKADPSPVGGASHEKPASSCHAAGVFLPFTFHAPLALSSVHHGLASEAALHGFALFLLRIPPSSTKPPKTG